MSDSSDLEFDNLLKNAKSTCKKKNRIKNTLYGKVYKSCPPKRYQDNYDKPLPLEENAKYETPDLKGCRTGGEQSRNSTALKTKMPKLNLHLLLHSSDDDDFAPEESEKCSTKSSKKGFQKLNGILALSKLAIHDNVEESLPQIQETRPKSPCPGTQKKITDAIIDDSLGEISELTNDTRRITFKDEVETKSTPLVIRTSGKSTRKVSTPDTSDDENVNPSSRLINQQPLRESEHICTSLVASTPTAKIHVPGLRDGYFGSTSRKTPKNNIKFLVSCLDDTLIEPDPDFNSFGRKETMTQNTPLDYSKPVPIHLYSKEGVNAFLAALSPESEVCNYDSKKYILHFESYRNDLTNVLYYFFNKFVFDNQIPADMTIDWKSALTSTAGYCEYRYHRDSRVRYCKISLSIKLLTSADKLRDTLIHELCHAAVHLLNNENDHHGPFWRFWTRTANLAFPDLPFITRCHSYKSKKKV